MLARVQKTYSMTAEPVALALDRGHEFPSRSLPRSSFVRPSPAGTQDAHISVRLSWQQCIPGTESLGLCCAKELAHKPTADETMARGFELP